MGLVAPHLDQLSVATRHTCEGVRAKDPQDPLILQFRQPGRQKIEDSFQLAACDDNAPN